MYNTQNFQNMFWNWLGAGLSLCKHLKAGSFDFLATLAPIQQNWKLSVKAV